MSNIEVNPGQQGFLGLDTVSSELLIAQGAGSVLDNMTIRRRTQVESRAGVDLYDSIPARPNHLPTISNIIPPAEDVPVLPVVNVDENVYFTKLKDELNNTVSWFMATRSPDSNLSMEAIPDDKIFVKGNPNVETATGKIIVGNFWGHNYHKSEAEINPASASITLKQLAALRVEPRLVSNIYASSAGPAELVNRELRTSIDGIVNLRNVHAAPLGVPPVPYLRVTREKSNVVTDFVETTDDITTFAYRAVHVRDNKMGAPCAPEYFVTRALPNRMTTTWVTATTMRISNIAPSDVEFVVGDKFYVNTIVDAAGALMTTMDRFVTITTKTANVGTPANWDYVFSFTGSVTEWSGTRFIDEWKLYFNPKVTIYPPKELYWDDPTRLHNSRAYFGSAINSSNTPFKVYRTKAVTQSLAVGATDPGAEFFELVGVTMATDFTNKTVSFTDVTPDRNLGGFLYTNPSQGNEFSANTPPPMCDKAEQYNGYFFWAGVKETPAALMDFKNFDGSDITISYTDETGTKSLTFMKTGSTLPSDTASHRYFIYTWTAGALPADRDEESSRSIVETLNKDKQNPFNAAYVSGWIDPPGSISLFSIFFREINFEILSPALDVSLFSNRPVEPAGLSKRTIFEIEDLPYRVRYSKFQQPFGCPTTNFFDLDGKPNILGLRQTSGMLNIVTDKGLWEFTGNPGQNENLRKKDATAFCVFPGAIQTMNDQLIVFTTQGIRVFGDGSIISRPVEDYTLKALSYLTNGENGLTFGGRIQVTSSIDEVHSEYNIFLVAPEGDEVSLKYNFNTQTWTRNTRSFVGGAFNRDEKRLMWFLSNGTTVMERTTETSLIDSDEIYEMVGTEFDSKVQLDSGLYEARGNAIDNKWRVPGLDGSWYPNEATIATVKDTIYFRIETTDEDDNTSFECGIIPFVSIKEEDNGVFTYITARPIPDVVDEDNLKVRVFLVKFIENRVTLSPFRFSGTFSRKKWSEIQIDISGNNIEALDVITSNDEQRSEKATYVRNYHFTRGWNFRPWGESPWGDPTRNAHQVMRTLVPLPHTSSRSLSVTLNNTGFNQTIKLQSIGVLTDVKSSRTAR